MEQCLANDVQHVYANAEPATPAILQPATTVSVADARLEQL